MNPDNNEQMMKIDTRIIENKNIADEDSINTIDDDLEIFKL